VPSDYRHGTETPLLVALHGYGSSGAEFAEGSGLAALAEAEGARRGVLHKAPKPGQDWRLDLPAIGPQTLRRAAAAGLAGVSVEAGGVLVLGLEETTAAADASGLFLWGRPRTAGEDAA
jgi:DUF1009 family protein